MSFKNENQKAASGYQHMNSYDKNIHRTGAMEEHGDKIVASIEAPILNERSGNAKKSNLDNSFSRNKPSERDGVLENSRDQRKMSVYQDPSIVAENKRTDSHTFERDNGPSTRQSRRQEAVAAPRNQSNPSSVASQRSFLQKCPSWLKILLLLIGLVALGGLVYWYFFKRGRTVIKHKKGEIVKKQETILKTTKPVTEGAPIVVANKTITQTTVKQNKPDVIEVSKQVGESQPQSKQLIKNQTTIAVTKEQKPRSVVVTGNKTTQTVNADDTSILVPKGNRTFCPDSQFLLNGNCMSCPPGMTWSGLNCMMNSVAKHLKRVHN